LGKSDSLPTADILTALIALPESPWGDLKGKPITDRALSTRLRQYGVRSKNVRIGEKISKGYAREDFHDAWLRYLPPPAAEEAATSATGATADVADRDPGVADTCDGKKPINSAGVTDVADVAAARGNGHGHGSGRVYAVHNHPTKPGEVRPCDYCGVGGRLTHWDWHGRTEPVWLHEKCEEPFAGANTPPPTAPDDGLEVPGFFKRSGIQMPGGGRDLNRAPHQRPDRRPALGPVGDSLDDLEPPFGGSAVRRQL
jgi:hypothetical protein